MKSGMTWRIWGVGSILACFVIMAPAACTGQLTGQSGAGNSTGGSF